MSALVEMPGRYPDEAMESSRALTAPGVSPSAPTEPAPQPIPPGALTFNCGNCGLEFDWPYCDCCGATLTPKSNAPTTQLLTLSVAGASTQGA